MVQQCWAAWQKDNMRRKEQTRLDPLQLSPAKAFQYQFLADICHTCPWHAACFLVYVALYFVTMTSLRHILSEWKWHYDDFSTETQAMWDYSVIPAWVSSVSLSFSVSSSPSVCFSRSSGTKKLSCFSSGHMYWISSPLQISMKGYADSPRSWRAQTGRENKNQMYCTTVEGKVRELSF